MQYKVSPTNVLWSPKNGPTIRLWKENGIGRAKLPTKVSNPIPFRSIWGNEELKASEKERLISSKILNCIKF